MAEYLVIFRVVEYVNDRKTESTDESSIYCDPGELQREIIKQKDDIRDFHTRDLHRGPVTVTVVQVLPL